MRGISLLLLVALFGVAGAFPVHAQIPTTYTNDNFWTSEHDQPLSFSRDSWGNFYGVTLTGKFFSQTNIENQYGIRLQKFSIDQAYFYISDRGVIRAESDLVALSIYLTYST